METTSPERRFQGPLFVVGMWRSGTSLFYALLNQHPQIALFYEGDLPLLWPLFLGRKAKTDWPERWEFWNSAPTRHRLNLDALPRGTVSLREACDAAWRQHAGLAIGGCKSPNYFEMLPSLATQFPGARFIVIWRNPIDVCRSMVRASEGDSFFAKRGMVLRLLRGSQELKTGVDALQATGIPVHEVQYEALVDDPQHVMAGVCRFLGLPFDVRMTSLQDADRSAIYDGEHHQMVKSERIDGTNGNRRKLGEEVLPLRIRCKVERYIAFWRQQNGGRWPALPETVVSRPKAGFALERLLDRILYRAFRTFDQAVVLIYCFAPLRLLKTYRAMKGRHEAVVVSKEPLVGISAKD